MLKPMVWYYLQPNLGFGSNKHFFRLVARAIFHLLLSWLKVEKFFMKIPFCVFITYTCYFYGTHSLRKVTHSLWKKLLIVKKEITEWQKRKSNRRRRGLYDAKRSLKFRMRRLESCPWDLLLPKKLFLAASKSKYTNFPTNVFPSYTRFNIGFFYIFKI